MWPLRLTLGTLACLLLLPACAARLATPPDNEGPFYFGPHTFGGKSPGDVVCAASSGAPMFNLTVQVLDTASEEPRQDSALEVWQADSTGAYHATRCRGRFMTDAAGNVSLATAVPGYYSGRPAHLHFKVFSSGRLELTTQMYFPFDPVLLTGRDAWATIAARTRRACGAPLWPRRRGP